MLVCGRPLKERKKRVLVCLQKEMRTAGLQVIHRYRFIPRRACGGDPDGMTTTSSTTRHDIKKKDYLDHTRVIASIANCRLDMSFLSAAWCC